MKMVISVLGLLFCVNGFAHNVSGEEIINIPDSSARPKSIMLYKIKSGKTIEIAKGRVVSVHILNFNGERIVKRAKRAVLTNINGHELTFKPIDKSFEEFKCADSTLTYIGFATFGSVTRGIVVNSLGVSLLTVGFLMVVPVTLIEIFGGSATPGDFASTLFEGAEQFEFDDFHRHIKFFRYSGVRKWGLKISD